MKQKNKHSRHSHLIKRGLELDKKLSQKSVLVTVITLIVCALILFLRKPEALTHAQFWAEDGVIWFAQAYNKGFVHTIAQPYSGTFSVLTRAAGYIVSLAPIRYAPLLFSLIAVSVQLLPVFIVCSSRFKSIVRYRYVAIIVSLLYVCITNSSEVFVNLANIQWHLGVAAFLVLIASKPDRRAWKIFDIVVLGITGLTGPLGLILVIVAGLMWLINRNRRSLINTIVLAVSSACQVLSLFILTPGQRGGSVVSWGNIAKMVSGQIFTAGLLGPRHANYFYDSFMLYGALIAGLLIILYAVIKGPSWLRYANLYSLILFIFMLASLKPLKGVDVWGILTHESTGQRYWYIPILVWLITLLWILLAAKSLIMRSVCATLLLLFVGIGIPGSWRIHPYPDQHYSYYADKFDTVKSGHNMKIPTNPEPWFIVLKKH